MYLLVAGRGVGGGKSAATRWKFELVVHVLLWTGDERGRKRTKHKANEVGRVWPHGPILDPKLVHFPSLPSLPPLTTALEMASLSILFLLFIVFSSIHSSPLPSTWSLAGKTAVVTGGTKGIGRSVVEHLLQFDAKVLTCSRNAAELEALKKEVGAGDRLVTCVCDCSTAEGQAALAASARLHFGETLDVLVNNVGMNIRKPTLDYSSEEIAKIYNTNFLSCYEITRLLHPLLKRTGNFPNGATSSVVNIGSVAGVTCMKSGTVYAATKAAMVSLVEKLDRERARAGERERASEMENGEEKQMSAKKDNARARERESWRRKFFSESALRTNIMETLCRNDDRGGQSKS